MNVIKKVVEYVIGFLGMLALLMGAGAAMACVLLPVFLTWKWVFGTL